MAASKRKTASKMAAKTAHKTADKTEAKTAIRTTAGNTSYNARSVLVTGGSRGLGLAIAQKLAAAGYQTIALARRETEEVAAAIARAEEAGQGALAFVPFDLGKIDGIPDLVRRLRKQFGPLYALINNAALGLSGTLALMHHTKIEEMVRLNTLSPIVLTKYVLRGMMADGAGRIVNVASIVASSGASGVAAYADQGVDGRLHPLACPRSRSARHHPQRGSARRSGDRHDASIDRRAACPRRPPQRPQSPRRGRRRRRHDRVSAQRAGAQHHRHGHHRGRRRHGVMSSAPDRATAAE
jgi:short chain dehydrogenase